MLLSTTMNSREIEYVKSAHKNLENVNCYYYLFNDLQLFKVNFY